jgi:FkbM family methyltransferase
VIFDVGANIGVTSILFANSYPQAAIYAFEPEPSNFKLLVENTAPYENVKCFNVGLGGKTEKRSLMNSDDEYNHGGFSFHAPGSDPSKQQTVDVVNILDFIRNENHLKIDVMKVDTEGCEHEILWPLYLEGRLPPYIMGEMHGQTDDWRAFGYISLTHDIRINKDFGQRCYPFYALKRPEVVVNAGT